MKGKEKCKALKEIRRKIAEENDIEYAVAECKFQGDCKGTCPKCEAELVYLEKELKTRQAVGKAVVVAGLALGTVGTLGGCAVTDLINQVFDSGVNGMMEMAPVEVPVEATTGEMPAEPEEEPVEEVITEGEMPEEKTE